MLYVNTRSTCLCQLALRCTHGNADLGTRTTEIDVPTQKAASLTLDRLRFRLRVKLDSEAMPDKRQGRTRKLR